MADHRQSLPGEREENDAHPDATLGRLAAEQHGVVARRQLLAAGIVSSTIGRRVDSGHLVPLHRGVYAVGHARLTREGHWTAAVLAVGPRAVLSHRDAAALHGLRPPGDHARTHVTTPQRAAGTSRIRVRRTSVLDPSRDVAVVEGIPATSVARTLVDLAGVATREQLAKALAEAERRKVLDVRAIEDVLARTRHRRGGGHAAIRAALARHDAIGVQLTRSPLERAFLALCRAYGLPRPATNVWLGDMEVDACWRAERVVVEADGWSTHSTRRAFAEDRERSNALQMRGWIVLRFTHGQIVHEREAVARTVAGALTARAAGAR